MSRCKWKQTCFFLGAEKHIAGGLVEHLHFSDEKIEAHREGACPEPQRKLAAVPTSQSTALYGWGSSKTSHQCLQASETFEWDQLCPWTWWGGALPWAAYRRGLCSGPFPSQGRPLHKAKNPWGIWACVCLPRARNPRLSRSSSTRPSEFLPNDPKLPPKTRASSSPTSFPGEDHITDNMCPVSPSPPPEQWWRLVVCRGCGWILSLQVRTSLCCAWGSSMRQNRARVWERGLGAQKPASLSNHQPGQTWAESRILR